MKPYPIYQPHREQLAGLLAEPDPLLVIPEPDQVYLETLIAQLSEVSDSCAITIEAIDGAGRWLRGPADHMVAVGEHIALDSWLFQHSSTVKKGRGLLWLRVSEQELERSHISAIQALGSTIRRYSSPWRILITGAEARLSPGITSIGRMVALERPRRESGKNCPLRDFIANIIEPSGGVDQEEVLDLAAERLQGLEASTILRILERALHRARKEHDICARIREERDALLKEGILEFRQFDAKTRLEEIGGLHVLRQYLESTGALFADWREEKLEVDQLKKLLPKGMLLVGLPGCGKSLSAEVAAAHLELPLLQLHMGRLMGRYLGESESNLEHALASAKAAAPCVLWIDEIEKAVGGLGGEEGNGTGNRMLGRLLGWMQDNRDGIFLVGTANELDHIPPELLRRGRFDEHFLINLPTTPEREEILKGLLKRIDHASSERDRSELASELAKKTADFSGADLQAYVLAAAQRAWFAEYRHLLKLEDFPAIGKDFLPQAHQFKEKYEKLKEKTSKLGFRNASSSDGLPLPALKRIDKPANKLPPSLERLLYGRETMWLSWGAGKSYFEIFTKDGQRRAKLAWEGEAIVRVYRVVRENSGTYAIVAFMTDNPGNAPTKIVVYKEDSGLKVYYKYNDSITEKPATWEIHM
jgi:ATP-dependent 26S proteasome regulatory subunit